MTVVQQIPLEQLEIGRWYVGRGRNGNVGLWSGTEFLVISNVGKRVSNVPPLWDDWWGIKYEPYFTESSGCFQPFMRIDEGTIAERMNGPDGERYAKSLCLNMPPQKHDDP